jgi:hypothetical protein
VVVVCKKNGTSMNVKVIFLLHELAIHVLVG